MAQKLVLFFGRDPKLSLAETLFFFSDNKIVFSEIQRTEKFIAMEIEKGPDAKQLMRSLGGTTKIARVLFEISGLAELEKKLGEIRFFFSMQPKLFYHAAVLTEQDDCTGQLREILAVALKEQRIKAMFKHPRSFGEKSRAQETMSPGELERWCLLDEGFELLLIKNKDAFLVCKTIAATDTKEMKKRDLGRPAQKPKHEISLRLARIMLNLAGATKGKTILDPFCGTGTIMQEALFNGASTIGIELDRATADMARKNLAWFEQGNKTNGAWKVLNADATKLSSVLKKGSFDCVATEPFMGPLIDSILPEVIVKKTIAELEALYSAVFAELAKTTIQNAGQRIVFILPTIPCTNGKKIAVSESVFSKSGFVVVNPAVEEIFPYNYMTEQSKILRRIYVLEKE